METKLKIAKGMCFSALALCGVDISSSLYMDAKHAVTAEIHERWVDGFSAVASRMGFEPKTPPLPLMDAKRLVVKAAVSEGINPDLALAVWQHESKGNQFAESHAGAMGHMQIMPVNAVRLCGYQSSKELWDERKNITCGVRYLAQLLRDNKWDVERALRSYNGGPKCAGGCQSAENMAYPGKVLKELAKNVEGEA